MKKRLISLLLCLCMVLTLLPVTAIPAAAAVTGSGTAADPYMISTADDLKTITGSGYYKLANNITLIGEWTPISSFSGVLDGGGYKISGLSMKPTYEEDGNSPYTVKIVTSKALILTLEPTGVIKNLTLSGANLNTIDATGHHNHINTNSALLVATNKGTITTCTLDGCTVYGYNEGSVTCAAHEGGFTWDNQGSLLNCIVTGTSRMTVGWDADYVDGDMGFMAGRNTGTIANCVVKGRAFTNDVFSGMVSGMPAYLNGSYTSSAIGGIVGKNNTGGRVYNCYFYGMFCRNSSNLENFNYTTGLVIGQNIGQNTDDNIIYASIDAVPSTGDSTHTNEVTSLIGDIPGNGSVNAAGTATKTALVSTFNTATTTNSMGITGLLPMTSGTEYTIDTSNAAAVTLQNTSPSGGSATQYIAKGSYTIPTYSGSAAVTMHINKATATVTANSLNKLYGQTNPAYTIAGLLGDDAADEAYQAKLAKMFTAASGADATGAIPVGIYPITVALADGHSLTEDPNYNFTIGDQQGSLTVSKAPLTVHIADAARGYGKENPAPTASYEGFIEGEDAKVLGGTLTADYDSSIAADTAVGSYPDVFTVSGLTADNYAISYAYVSGEKGDLTIGKLPVTASVASTGTSSLVIGLTEAIPGLTAENFAVALDGASVSLTGVTASTGNNAYTLQGAFTGGKTYTITLTIDSTKYELTGSPLSASVSSGSSGGSSGGGSSTSVGKATVTLNDTLGGTATAFSDGTVKITANDGWKIKNVTVNGTSKGAVSSLSGLKSTDTVAVTFEKIEDTAGKWTNPFIDVSEDAWYYSAVQYANQNNLFAGTGPQTFSPDAAMTRAMVWTVLARANGQDTSGGTTWYSKGQTWAMENQISDGQNPDADVTREQLVTILWRYAGSPKAESSLSGFTDAALISDYAKTAMQWAVAQGIINGSDGKLNPQDPASRAQVAAIMMRFLKK